MDAASLNSDQSKRRSDAPISALLLATHLCSVLLSALGEAAALWQLTSPENTVLVEPAWPRGLAVKNYDITGTKEVFIQFESL